MEEFLVLGGGLCRLAPGQQGIAEVAAETGKLGIEFDGLAEGGLRLSEVVLAEQGSAEVGESRGKLRVDRESVAIGLPCLAQFILGRRGVAKVAVRRGEVRLEGDPSGRPLGLRLGSVPLPAA